MSIQHSRARWGRRLFYLLVAFPFVGAAYEILTVGIAWSDDPYVIRIRRNQMYNVFGLAAPRSMHLIRSSVYAWLNVGPDLPALSFVNESYSGFDDADVEADTCCDFDCANGCIGKSTRYPFSDDCSITLYKNTIDPIYFPSDDGSQTLDIQSVATHEFGHCLLLGHPSTGAFESIMNQGQYYLEKYPSRFPRWDDVQGVTATQGARSSFLKTRTGPGGAFSTLTRISTSNPGLATRSIGGYNWHLIGHTDENYVLKILGIRNNDVTNLTGCWMGDKTYDGVAVSQDTIGFAVAFRDISDNGNIHIYRGVVPQHGACPSIIAENVLSFSSRRRPSLSYDPATGRLVLVTIDKNSGHIYTATSTSATGGWTSSTRLDDTERTDAPAGIDCGYWTRAGGYRCIMAFPTPDGNHYLRLCEGYVTYSGSFTKTSCETYEDVRLGNVSPDVRFDSSTLLRIFSTGTNDARSLYYHLKTCNTYGGSCSFSTNSASGTSPMAPGFSQGREVITGF